MQFHRSRPQILLQQRRRAVVGEAAENLPAQQDWGDVQRGVPEPVLRGLHLRSARGPARLVPAHAQGAARVRELERGLEASDEADGVQRGGAVDAVDKFGHYQLDLGAPGGEGGGGDAVAAVFLLVFDGGAVEGAALLPAHRHERCEGERAIA